MTQPPPSPLDAAGQMRLRTLSEELRCLVCQNQTLADSHADLAVDLRNQVQELIAAGKSNDQIKQYLVERYGDFVLYRPPVQGNTLLLWGGPFALLAGGGLIWAIVQRRSRLATRGGIPASAAAASATTSGLPVNDPLGLGQAGTLSPGARPSIAGPSSTGPSSAGPSSASQSSSEPSGTGASRKAPASASPSHGVAADMVATSRGVAGTAVAGSVVAGSAVPGAAWTAGATGTAPAAQAARSIPERPAASGLERARRLLDD